MKIALIGYGNIANAIINGMLSSEKTKVMDETSRGLKKADIVKYTFFK